MVKIMKLFLTLLLLHVALFGANVDKFAKEMGYERDYATAISKAKRQHKPLVMVLGADYCPWCRKFEHQTLSSSLIKPRLNKAFVVLIVDKKFDIDSFPHQFRTQFTPRVFFIDPKDEHILFDTTGYIKKKEFGADLDKVLTFYGGVK